MIISLVNRLICQLMIKVSWSWANTSINIKVIFWYDGYISKALLNTIRSVTSSTLHPKKQSNIFLRPWGHNIITTSGGSFDCINRHHITGWLKKMSLGYTKGVGWGVCTKSGICPSTWQIDTLSPLDDNCIYEACKRVTRSRRMQCHRRVKRLVRRGWTWYSDIGDLTSDKI
jgi:hypothetical protein